MMTGALNGLVDKYNLKGVHIDEVVGGAVVTHSKDWNLAREAVLGTKLAPSTPGITMMQACGTSLQAAHGHRRQDRHRRDRERHRRRLRHHLGCADRRSSRSSRSAWSRRSSRSRSCDKLKAFKGFSPGELAPQPPIGRRAAHGPVHGPARELMAQEWEITRAEQDQLAFESHTKAAEAYRSGYMDDLVVPFAGVFRDNNLRADIDAREARAR